MRIQKVTEARLSQGHRHRGANPAPCVAEGSSSQAGTKLEIPPSRVPVAPLSEFPQQVMSPKYGVKVLQKSEASSSVSARQDGLFSHPKEDEVKTEVGDPDLDDEQVSRCSGKHSRSYFFD